MSEVIRCVSPVDGSVYLERAVADDARIQAALRRAREAQAQWSRVDLAERARRCNAMVDAMLGMKEEIVPELAWQMGRPVRFGAGELGGFEERARHMIDIAPEALDDVRPAPKDGFERYVRRTPLGIVLVVAPWNFPYLTAVNSIIPALMAGNSVLLKHASQTLAVGERFQKAADGTLLPEGLFQNLVLNHVQTAALIGSRHVDQVNFTGSVRGGRQMEEAAAGRFIGLGLELGGKDPAYVREDVNLDHAVENLVDGAYFNSGQSCCGIERIYVHERRYDAFVEGFTALTRAYLLGDPLDPATTLGPMVRPAAAEFVRGQVEAAIRAGARALVDPCGFERDAPGSAYMAPQVLVDVNHDMSVMKEESFGPVVGIMKVKDDAQALALMNDSEYGLTASIWTRDRDRAERLGQDLQTGTVFMNRCDYLDPTLAWTGVKNSGRGVTLSKVGYETLTRSKSFHLRLGNER